MKTKCFEASVNNKDFEFGGKEKIKINNQAPNHPSKYKSKSK